MHISTPRGGASRPGGRGDRRGRHPRRGPRRRRSSESVAKARIEPKRRKRIVDIPRFFSRPIPTRSAFATDLDVENVSACPAGACDPEFDWRPRGSALVAVLSASRPAGDPQAPVEALHDLIRARGSPVNVLSARPRPARPSRGRRIIMMTDTAGTRTRDRSDDGPWVVAGVDTHKDTHHVAAGSAATGAGLGDMRVPATPAGHDQLHDFVRSRGRIRMIGIEGTGSYGAGLARAPVGRRRADPRGHPSQAPPSPPRQVRPDRRLRRRRQGAGRGRRPARGQDRHRPLRTDPGAPGRAPQRDEGPRRRPPADHRPADHRPRRRAHPLRPSQRRGGSSAPWPARAPHRTAHRPRIDDHADTAPPGPPPPDPGPTRSPTSTPSCAH